MDDSIEIHVPLEALGGPTKKKSHKSDESTRHKSKFNKQSATSDHSSDVQSKVIHPAKSNGSSGRGTGSDSHRHRSRDESQHRDHHSSSRHHDPPLLSVAQQRHWYPQHCPGTRLPDVVIRRVYRDQHNSHGSGTMDVVQQILQHLRHCLGMGFLRLQAIPSRPAMTDLRNVQ